MAVPVAAPTRRVAVGVGSGGVTLRAGVADGVGVLVSSRGAAVGDTLGSGVGVNVGVSVVVDIGATEGESDGPLAAVAGLGVDLAVGVPVDGSGRSPAHPKSARIPRVTGPGSWIASLCAKKGVMREFGALATTAAPRAGPQKAETMTDLV